MTATKYQKMWFPWSDWEKENRNSKVILIRRHQPHISLAWHIVMFCTSAKPAFCHLTVLAAWFYIGLPNGHGSQALGMAWQKLQLCGAVLQCEPPSLGPEPGSSWSPGAFLERTKERGRRKLFFLASFVLSPLCQQPVVLVEQSFKLWFKKKEAKKVRDIFWQPNMLRCVV